MEVLGTCSDAGCHPQARLRARSRFEGQARGRTASVALRTPSLVNRYYDPTTGLFLTQDPMVDETGQAYSYAGDDPVNESDPSGLSVTDPGFVAQVKRQEQQLPSTPSVNCGPNFDHTGICPGHPQYDYDYGASGLCVGAGFATPFGGAIGTICVVVGDGQIGLTETGAAGTSVRGYFGDVGVSGFDSSDTCNLKDLGGPFHGGGVSTGVTPLGGSYASGKSASGPVDIFGLGLGYGAGEWRGTTETATQVLGESNVSSCGC